MSTRCNLFLTSYTGPALWIYRHSDGYLSCTGADILSQVATALKQAAMGHPLTTATLANRFLQQLYPKASYQSEPSHVYGLTDDEHGDIEYLYRLTVNETENTIKAEYKARNMRTDRWSLWQRLTVAQVNQEIAAMNDRAEQYYRSMPGRTFEPQPLLNPDGSPIVLNLTH